MIIEIFKRNIMKWPSEIDISDGVLIPESNGFRSGNLLNIWDGIEQSVVGNDWDEIAAWVIYGILHKQAKEGFIMRLKAIYPHEVQIDLFEKRLKDALPQHERL